MSNPAYFWASRNLPCLSYTPKIIETEIRCGNLAFRLDITVVFGGSGINLENANVANSVSLAYTFDIITGGIYSHLRMRLILGFEMCYFVWIRGNYLDDARRIEP